MVAAKIARLPAVIKVSKRDAARQQLHAAIRPWFANGEPIAICPPPPADAAHGVVHTLFRAAGHRGLLFNAGDVIHSPILDVGHATGEVDGVDRHAQTRRSGAQLGPRALHLH